jgi:large subunit ribosomal protein L11
VERGAAAAGRAHAGTISPEQLREIAALKLPDLNARTLEAAEATVAGTARSMGIVVRNGADGSR